VDKTTGIRMPFFVKKQTHKPLKAGKIQKIILKNENVINFK
jgi:hypothetical protein